MKHSLSSVALKLLALPIALGLLGAPASAQSLVNGGVVSGAISPAGDTDTYTFTASAGEGFQLSIADVNATSLIPRMDLYDPSGTFLQTSWNSDVAIIVRTASVTGTYSVVVSDASAGATETGAYDLFFTRAPGANEGGALPNGHSVVDTVDLGDLDSYTFDASAGEGFQLSVADLNTTTLVPIMRLYDPSGAFLQASWNSDVAIIVRTAATTGTYTVVVSDGNNQPSQTGAYELFFTRAPGANEGGALPNGGSVVDTVDLGDLDSYTFQATAGEGFQLSVADVNATALVPLMRLYDPSGALIQTNWAANVAIIVRTASVAGTYTVVVSDGNNHPSQTGAYELFFTRAPGANEGGALPNGGSVTGTVDLGDLDSYTFSASAGEGFQLSIADVNATALVPAMRLYDPSGALIQTNWAANVAIIVRTAATSGTYTVVVSDGNNQPSQTGAYDLFFTLRPGANEGGTLPNGGVVSGVIELGDLDSYTFDANAGEGFQLQLADTAATALVPLLRLYDPSGTLLQTHWNANVASITRTASTTGTYTVVASDGNNQPAQTGAYDLFFTLAPGANEGGQLPNGGSVTDTVDLGDLDSYTFDANAGQGFQLRIADLNATSLTPLLRLYDPSGTLLESRWQADVAVILRTAATSGTYTVVVSDGNNSPAQTGDYELFFVRAPGANEGGKLLNGGSLSGFIDLGDLDSFTFAALAGEDYQLQATDLAAGPLFPRLRVYDPSGALLQTAAGANTALISRTAATTGTYTVVVEDGNAVPKQTGAYGLYLLRGIETYCTAGTTASGCTADMSALGDPSVSAGTGFFVSAGGAEGGKDGLFFFGTNGRQAKTWGNGSSFQCVIPPVKRSPIISAGGTNGSCDGHFQLDFNAMITAQPAKAPPSGSIVQIQCWFRDPQNTSNQSTSLSNALEFTLHP